MSKWIRKGDLVKVIAGNDKGKQGEVLECNEERVLVKGVNVRKKHLKRTQESQGPRIVDMEVPIHISNVVPCDTSGNRLKLKVSFENGKKQLVYRNDQGEQVYRVIGGRG